MIWPFRRRSARASRVSFLVTVHWPPHPKPRVRIRQDGWVRHDGGPFPFDPSAFVEVIYAGGERLEGEWAERAKAIPNEWWRHRPTSPRWAVKFYRIVPPPTFTEVQP